MLSSSPTLSPAFSPPAHTHTTPASPATPPHNNVQDEHAQEARPVAQEEPLAAGREAACLAHRVADSDHPRSAGVAQDPHSRRVWLHWRHRPRRPAQDARGGRHHGARARRGQGRARRAVRRQDRARLDGRRRAPRRARRGARRRAQLCRAVRRRGRDDPGARRRPRAPRALGRHQARPPADVGLGLGALRQRRRRRHRRLARLGPRALGGAPRHGLFPRRRPHRRKGRRARHHLGLHCHVADRLRARPRPGQQALAPDPGLRPLRQAHRPGRVRRRRRQHLGQRARHRPLAPLPPAARPRPRRPGRDRRRARLARLVQPHLRRPRPALVAPHHRAHRRPPLRARRRQAARRDQHPRGRRRHVHVRRQLVHAGQRKGKGPRLEAGGARPRGRHPPRPRMTRGLEGLELEESMFQ